MAIYHLSIKTISRGGGKSAVASASYRSGEKLHDDEQGRTFFYQKSEVAYSEIILCKNAPQEYAEREKLWNAVEAKESASNARLAREFEIALPKELSLEENIKLAHEYAQTLADEGMCVDFSIHNKEGNPHIHLMATVRSIDENGQWTAKSRKVYDLDENGEKIPIIDKKTKQQKVDKDGRKQWKNHKEDYNDWNNQEKVEEWRERWEQTANKYLTPEQQIDHRSLKEQGLDRIPTIHEGYASRQIAKRGESAERVEYNAEIKSNNQELDEITRQMNVLQQLIAVIKKRWEVAINERFGRIKSTRGTDEADRGNAGGNRELTSAEQTISDIIRDSRIEANQQRLAERQSAEISDNKATEREDREAERERQATREREEARRAEQERAREREKAKERSRRNPTIR